ncbi:LysR substrate-binding domain-containing protein [Galactobacter sp.]|mgnify:CR=1 FL=1|uniref:LysR substrate-binding domain-containing protein n=1 Tax=Galactobacter sp. TaxID=2676125 RepID=UPI0025C16D29|nr:LysR substrate-binding domain-containing protein [Galactobacter sp.]
MARKPEITLSQLRYFVGAAERLSMTETARDFFVAQSAVSSAIAQLESQVGAQLFIRQRSKGLVLTSAGLQFLGDVRSLLGGLDDALDAARGVDNQVRGTIRIGCFVTISPFLVPQLITLARERHPHLEIQVEEFDAGEAIEALRSGRVEFHVGYDFGFGAEVARENVGDIAPHVVLPADHPLAERDAVHLRELHKERFVLLDLPSSREYFLGMLDAAGLEPDVRHRAKDYETVRALVARGQGFSVLNLHPAHPYTYDGSRVATVPLMGDVPALPLVLASLRSVRRSARALAVAELIREIAPRLQKV